MVYFFLRLLTAEDNYLALKLVVTYLFLLLLPQIIFFFLLTAIGRLCEKCKYSFYI